MGIVFNRVDLAYLANEECPMCRDGFSVNGSEALGHIIERSDHGVDGEETIRRIYHVFHRSCLESWSASQSSHSLSCVLCYERITNADLLFPRPVLADLFTLFIPRRGNVPPMPAALLAAEMATMPASRFARELAEESWENHYPDVTMRPEQGEISINFNLHEPIRRPIEIFRTVMEDYFRLGFTGTISVWADDPSDYFPLIEMGVIPLEFQILIVEELWGSHGRGVLEQFLTNGTIESNFDLDDLQKMLTFARTGNIHSQNLSFTIEELWQNRAELSALQNRRDSYIRYCFVRKLLREMTLHNDSNQFGVAREFVMSELGIARWRQAITEHRAFEFFSRGEPLRPYMTQEQQNQMDELLNQIEELPMGA